MKDGPTRPRAGSNSTETTDGIGIILDNVKILLDFCGENSIPVLNESLMGTRSMFTELVSRHSEESLSCAVLALTKSGKSTLINALVGDALLPSSNVPETARICKVVHLEHAHEPFMMEPASTLAVRQPEQKSNTSRAARPQLSSGKVSAAGLQSNGDSGPRVEQAVITCQGGPAIRARLHELNHTVRSRNTFSTSASATSQRLSSIPKFHNSLTPEGGGPMKLDRNMLAIYTRIASLRSFAEGSMATAGKGGGSPVRLHLLDTPGPNEAGETGLRDQVEWLLGTVDAAVYVLDYTKLKTAEEASMFQKLKEANSPLLRRLSQRLFIAVNKWDENEDCEGLGPEATRQYVSDLMTRQMDCDGFQLHPDQVLLLSARNALLSRLVLREGWPERYNASTSARGGLALTDTQRRFAKACSLSANKGITPEEAISSAHALLKSSGVLELEAKVVGHLYNHRGSIKQLALVDDLGRLLGEIHNLSTICVSALSSEAECLEERKRDLQKELTNTQKTFDDVRSHADAIIKEVTDEVWKRLDALHCKLISEINSALVNSSLTRSDQQPYQSGAQGGWEEIKKRAKSIFSRRGQQEEKALLQQQLTALHEDLTQQIHIEVKGFWLMVENVAADHHAKLLGILNQHLKKLSRKVEAEVSCSLDVKLAPMKLELTPPNIAQFHYSLEALIAEGVVQSREQRTREFERTEYERIHVNRKEGICRWRKFEDVPRTHTVLEPYFINLYQISPQKITTFFTNMVRDAISATKAHLEVYVSKFANDQLSQARQQLECYSDRYMRIMTGALEVGQLGAQHKYNALVKVQSVLDRVDSIKGDLEALLRQDTNKSTKEHSNKSSTHDQGYGSSTHDQGNTSSSNDQGYDYETQDQGHDNSTHDMGYDSLDQGVME